MAGNGTARIALAVGVAVIVGAGIAWSTGAFRARTHIPANVVYEYRQGFTPGQLAPGWKLLSVGPNVDDPTQIVHRVEVPAALAGEIVMMSGSDRNAQVAEVACPPADHEIWSRLSRGHDVVVELYTEKGAFDSVSCRSAVSP
ncbi:MAG: hypothetical protein R3190_12850 [Thermoanaerobaculia bacterium]|nr:hypothetical protein [Thermoanaerobaculia bacterium]